MAKSRASGINDIESKLQSVNNKLQKLAYYATPAGYDEKKATEYYKVKRQQEVLRKRHDEILDSMQSRSVLNTSTRTFVNSYGEATTREITSQTYKRSQKRLEKIVANMFRNR